MLVLFVQLQVMGLLHMILIVKIEYHIILFIVRDSVFQLWVVSAEFVSVCIYSQFSVSAVHGEFDWRICSSPTVCSQFRYESSTGTWYLKLVLELEFSTGNLHWKLGSSTETHTCEFCRLQTMYVINTRQYLYRVCQYLILNNFKFLP